MERILNSLKALLVIAAFLPFYACQNQDQAVEPQSSTEAMLTLEAARQLVESGGDAAAGRVAAGEQVTYAFSATFTEGPSTGDSLTGELKVTLQKPVDGFQRFYGNLLLPDSTKIPASGIFTGKNEVYVFFYLPEPTGGVIFGRGTRSEAGVLTGEFFFRPSKEELAGRGTWVATPKDSVPAPAKSIVEIAVSDPRFTKLVSALQATGLVAPLSGPGPFTVFAPTDSAFAALDSVPGGEALKAVLLYHVVLGEFTAAEIVKLRSLVTLQGDRITIAVNERGEVILNDRVKIIQTDILASNGVIHVIDAVLLPPAKRASK